MYKAAEYEPVDGVYRACGGTGCTPVICFASDPSTCGEVECKNGPKDGVLSTDLVRSIGERPSLCKPAGCKISDCCDAGPDFKSSLAEKVLEKISLALYGLFGVCCIVTCVGWFSFWRDRRSQLGVPGLAATVFGMLGLLMSLEDVIGDVSFFIFCWKTCAARPH